VNEKDENLLVREKYHNSWKESCNRNAIQGNVGMFLDHEIGYFDASCIVCPFSQTTRLHVPFAVR